MDGAELRTMIGNPTPAGIAAIILYLGGFLVCLRATIMVRERMDHSSPPYEYPVFWLVVAWCLLLMGFSREINLHTWLTRFIRILALRGGWYLERRAVQTWILIAVCATGLSVLGVVGWFLRGARWPYLLAFGGIVFLLGYAVVRLVSFHDVDVFLARKFGGITLNHFMEFGATLCVILAAWRSAPGLRLTPERTTVQAPP